MWLIDKLYMKLCLQDSDSCPISKLGPAHEFNGFGKLKCYCEFQCHQLESFDHNQNQQYLSVKIPIGSLSLAYPTREQKTKQKLLYNFIVLQSEKIRLLFVNLHCMQYTCVLICFIQTRQNHKFWILELCLKSRGPVLHVTSSKKLLRLC